MGQSLVSLFDITFIQTGSPGTGHRISEELRKPGAVQYGSEVDDNALSPMHRLKPFGWAAAERIPDSYDVIFL